jgi:hypothetical protein
MLPYWEGVMPQLIEGLCGENCDRPTQKQGEKPGVVPDLLPNGRVPETGLIRLQLNLSMRCSTATLTSRRRSGSWIRTGFLRC